MSRESANGWPACMVIAHIEAVTEAVPARKKRRRERRAKTALVACAAIVTALVILAAAL